MCFPHLITWEWCFKQNFVCAKKFNKPLENSSTGKSQWSLIGKGKEIFTEQKCVSDVGWYSYSLLFLREKSQIEKSNGVIQRCMDGEGKDLSSRFPCFVQLVTESSLTSSDDNQREKSIVANSFSLDLFSSSLRKTTMRSRETERERKKGPEEK